jgi:hypothetical protein
MEAYPAAMDHLQRELGPRAGSRPAEADLLGEPLLGRLLFAGEHARSARRVHIDSAMASGVREAKRLPQRAHVNLGGGPVNGLARTWDPAPGPKPARGRVRTSRPRSSRRPWPANAAKRLAPLSGPPRLAPKAASLYQRGPAGLCRRRRVTRLR